MEGSGTVGFPNVALTLFDFKFDRLTEFKKPTNTVNFRVEKYHLAASWSLRIPGLCREGKGLYPALYLVEEEG